MGEKTKQNEKIILIVPTTQDQTSSGIKGKAECFTFFLEKRKWSHLKSLEILPSVLAPWAFIGITLLSYINSKKELKMAGPTDHHTLTKYLLLKYILNRIK